MLGIENGYETTRKEIDICENISLENIHDSNLFLRKLWSELENGNSWNFCPFRDENELFIGFSKYGKVSFDYKKRGCINNIYFRDVNSSDIEIVKIAIRKAKNIEDIKKYYVKIQLPFICCDIKEDGLDTWFIRENDKSYLYSIIEAYSTKDLKYLICKKIEALRGIFSVYVRDVFALNLFKVSYTREEENYFEVHECEYEYDLDWIELDKIPTSKEGYFIIPKELLTLVNIIMNNNFYSKEIRLLINSAYAFYSSTHQLKLSEKSEVDRIGCINIANSMVISALEPLAELEDVPGFRCESCGAAVYSVVKKIKLLLERYFAPGLVKDIVNIYYSNRSKFFHEGIRNTEEYYIGICWPQIDERDGRSMLFPHAFAEYNLFDWVNYIIRKRLHDIINSL